MHKTANKLWSLGPIWKYPSAFAYPLSAVQCGSRKQDRDTCRSRRACTSVSCVWLAKVWNNLARQTRRRSTDITDTMFGRKPTDEQTSEAKGKLDNDHFCKHDGMIIVQRPLLHFCKGSGNCWILCNSMTLNVRAHCFWPTFAKI